jgi:hypothetical protein
VLVGLAIAAVCAPVFIRYRVSRPASDEPDPVSEHTPDDDKV